MGADVSKKKTDVFLVTWQKKNMVGRLVFFSVPLKLLEKNGVLCAVCSITIFLVCFLFARVKKKNLGSGRKNRVGQVIGNKKLFCLGLKESLKQYTILPTFYGGRDGGDVQKYKEEKINSKNKAKVQSHHLPSPS